MSGRSTFGVAAIRAAAKRRAEGSSLRATAAEIGMSYTAFRHFLAGGKPHPKTRQLLVHWYGTVRDGRTGPAKEDAAAALELIVNYIAQSPSESEKARRRSEVIEAISKT